MNYYSQKPLISVVMITYQQEKFIEEAINGVLNQNINLSVEFIIADDCSPDRTEQIIKTFESHPKNNWIKYLRHSNNIGIMQNLICALLNSKGKYIALCEGDDYWTDPYKLQKQVDFLEANDDCNYLFTNRSILKPNGDLVQDTLNLPMVFDLNFLLSKSIMPSTQTVMFRNPGLQMFKDWESILMKAFNGDWVLLFMLAHNSKIGFLTDTTAVYREGVGVNSKTNNITKQKNGIETNKSINKKTNYKFDAIIGGCDFHFRNITFGFMENNQKILGILWYFKTIWYTITHPSRQSLFSKTTILFSKHTLKLLLNTKMHG
jgi:glycosyltransferase involved in cell wall biosynthesis